MQDIRGEIKRRREDVSGRDGGWAEKVDEFESFYPQIMALFVVLK